MDADRTPILVGCGQVTQREADPQAALSPMDLTAAAAREAAENAEAGAKLIEALDTIVILRSFLRYQLALHEPVRRLQEPAEIDRRPDRRRQCRNV